MRITFCPASISARRRDKYKNGSQLVSNKHTYNKILLKINFQIGIVKWSTWKVPEFLAIEVLMMGLKGRSSTQITLANKPSEHFRFGV